MAFYLCNIFFLHFQGLFKTYLALSSLKLSLKFFFKK